MYRATANKLEIGLSPTNLFKQVFEPVGDILHPRNDDIVVTVDCPKDLTVLTDYLRLQQVLLNLGRNASKFVTSGFIKLRASVVDGMVEIVVEDSGPGIPDDMRRLLFQKYHTSLDVVTQGNGIGLSLCKNLVYLLKGEILLDESYESGIQGSPGARFVVKLNMPAIQTPINTSFTDRYAQADSSANSSGERESGTATWPAGEPIDPPASLLPEELSVLFVDDDAILRKLFIRSIHKVCPNWTIRGASSGEEALRLMSESQKQPCVDEEQGSPQQCPFDLVFIDQYMASSEPQLLGTETVRAMRARGVDCAVCGLSANDMEMEFKAAGADCFVLKPLPCEKTALLTELARITRRIRSEDAV